MGSKLWAFLLLFSCTLGVAVSASSSYAVQGLSALDIGVDTIHVDAPNPYVELRYLRLTNHVYTESTPFWWLLLTSAHGVCYPQISTDLFSKADNRTDYVGQDASVKWEKEPTTRRWNLTRVDEFSYKIGFLLAFQVDLAFEPEPVMHVGILDAKVDDEWRHVETPTRRLNSPPDNETLAGLGLNTSVFWRLQRTYEYKTFYLYEITFFRPESYEMRVSYTFTIPAIVLSLILVVSVLALVFAKLTLQAELTLYLGTAFFSLPFVLNYTRLGLGPITPTETAFYVVITISTGLALFSVILSALGKGDDESLNEFYHRCRLRDEDFEWAVD